MNVAAFFIFFGGCSVLVWLLIPMTGGYCSIVDCCWMVKSWVTPTRHSVCWWVCSRIFWMTTGFFHLFLRCWEQGLPGDLPDYWVDNWKSHCGFSGVGCSIGFPCSALASFELQQHFLHDLFYDMDIVLFCFWKLFERKFDVVSGIVGSPRTDTYRDVPFLFHDLKNQERETIVEVRDNFPPHSGNSSLVVDGL